MVSVKPMPPSWNGPNPAKQRALVARLNAAFITRTREVMEGKISLMPKDADLPEGPWAMARWTEV